MTALLSTFGCWIFREKAKNMRCWPRSKFIPHLYCASGAGLKEYACLPISSHHLEIMLSIVTNLRGIWPSFSCLSKFDNWETKYRHTDISPRDLTYRHIRLSNNADAGTNLRNNIEDCLTRFAFYLVYDLIATSFKRFILTVDIGENLIFWEDVKYKSSTIDRWFELDLKNYNTWADLSGRRYLYCACIKRASRERWEAIYYYTFPVYNNAIVIITTRQDSGRVTVCVRSPVSAKGAQSPSGRSDMQD
jgi:hypothetical protein